MTHTTLISVQELQAHLAEPTLRVFDCRFDLANADQGYRAYGEAHIPGARYAHLDRDLADPPGHGRGRHPLPDSARFGRWLGDNDVGPGSLVVAYDAQGGAIAARLWWLLRWCGHRNVAVLDGGWRAWQSAAYPVDDREPSPPAATEPYPVAPDDNLWIDAAGLARALEQRSVRLLDARAAARFRGEQEPLDPVAGHVPGAGNHPFTDDLDADGRFLPAATLRERLAQTMAPYAAADTVCMCGSGVTACHTLLALEAAGLPGARLYPGSWSEWIADPARPVATGD